MNKSHQTKLAIFDFDGTLADTLMVMISICNSLAHKYGYDEFTLDEIPVFKASRLSALIQILEPKLSTLLKLPFLLAEFRSLLHQQVQTIRFFDGIEVMLASLSEAGIHTGIVTSNSASFARKVLMHNHTEQHFSEIYSARYFFDKAKLIKRMMHKYQASQAQTVYLGDEIRDIDSAHAADIKIISVTWGYNSFDALQQHGADYLAKNPKELPALITSILDS